MITYISRLSQRRGKSFLSGFLLLVFGFFIVSPSAEARLIFSTEDDGTASSTYTLDVEGDVVDAENTDLTLSFGGGLSSAGNITYNDSTGRFTINKAVDFSGPLATPTTTITAASTTLDDTHSTVLADASSNAVTLNLPAAAGVSGRIYTFKAIDVSNAVTIDGNAAETIDGSATLVLSNANDSVTIQSDGTNWRRVSSDIAVAATNTIYSADDTLAAARTITSGGNSLTFTDGTDSIQFSGTGGDITFVDADGGAGITGPAGGALALTSGAGQGLDFNANAASTFDVAGTLGIDSTGTLSLNTSNNAAITTGTGVFTAGGNAVVVGTTDLQGNVSDSLGNLTLDDAVDITGNLDAQGDISDSLGNLVLNDTVEVTAGLDVQGAAGITLSNDETITNAVNGSIVLADSGGQTLTFDLDATDPTLNSSTGGLNIGLGGAAGDDLIVDTDTFVVESDNNRVGIGTTAPNSTLQVDGSWATKTDTITAAATTLDETHNTILADATSNAVTLNLPAAAGVAGRLYTIKAINVSNAITIDGNAAETIDGATTLALSNANDSVTIQSDGTNWQRVGSEIASAVINTIYSADDTLAGNRTITSGGNTLTFTDGTDSIQFGAAGGDITFIDADGGASITGSAGGAFDIAAGAGQALNLTGNAASTIDSNGTLSLNTTNNAAITTGTGLFTTGGDLTVNGNDLTFGNGESISNATDNVLAITSASTTLSGSLDVQGGDITLQNDETISNSVDGTVAVTATTTTLSGSLDVQGGDITLQNDETISNSVDGTITAGVAASGAFNVSTGNLTVGNGTADVTLDGEDAYIEGTLEVDGNTRFDGITEVNGAFETTTTTITAAATTLDATHSTILADANANAVTLNLPAAAGVAGRIYTIKATDVSNAITIDGNAAETIDGATTLALTTVNDAVTIQSDGTNWRTISGFGITNSSNVTLDMPAEYPNFTLVADGSNNRGTFESDHDAGAVRNYYQWSTRRAAQQDYDLVVQWPVPEDFSDFQATNPIQFVYQTTDGVIADNQIDVVSIADTSGAAMTLTGDTADLANAAWTTANLDYTGTPTFTPGQYLTITFRLHARNTGTQKVSRLGEMIFNYISN